MITINRAHGIYFKPDEMLKPLLSVLRSKERYWKNLNNVLI